MDQESKSVLVVDDDPIIRMDACLMLEDAGFLAYEIDNGDGAKDVLSAKASEFTLLFTDVEMPGHTDGFQLARYVEEHWPWIEIVVSSGHRSPGKNDLPPKAVFIQKPFSAAIVYDHVRKVLPKDKQPAPLKALE